MRIPGLCEVVPRIDAERVSLGDVESLGAIREVHDYYGDAREEPSHEGNVVGVRLAVPQMRRSQLHLVFVQGAERVVAPHV